MSTIFDFSNVKSISIPEGEVKQMDYETSGGTDVPVWSGEWSLTIALGNCVTKVKYKIGSGSWVNITSTTILTELDTDATVYIQAVEYEDDTNRYNYTNHNFDVSKTSDNDGETVTVYRDKETRYYTSSVTAGDYVQTVKIKKNSEAWSSAQSSVSITHIYDDTIYWEAVNYNENTTSGNTRWLYDGTLSDSFTQVGAKTITCSQTQTIQYNVTIKANRCSANYSSGWIDANTTVTWSCDTNRAFNSTGTKTTDTASITGEGTYEKSADWVNATAYNGTHCSVASGTTTGWKSYTTQITWNADTGYAFANNATSTTTDIAPGENTCSANNTRTYTITFAKGGSKYGYWKYPSRPVSHGYTLSRSGDTVTCKKGSGIMWTNTFTNGSETGYDYSVSYSDISSPVTDDQTITATTSRSRKTFTITFSNGTYGTWNTTSVGVEYGDTISKSGTKLTIYRWDASSTERGNSTYTLTAGDAQYSYDTTITYNTPITSNQTITPSDTRNTNKYTVYWNNWDGTRLETDYNVAYGTTPTYDGSTPTRDSSASTVYTFSKWDPSIGAITGDTTYTAQFSESTRQYTLSFWRDNTLVYYNMISTSPTLNKGNNSIGYNTSGRITLSNHTEYEYNFTSLSAPSVKREMLSGGRWLYNITNNNSVSAEVEKKPYSAGSWCQTGRTLSAGANLNIIAYNSTKVFRFKATQVRYEHSYQYLTPTTSGDITRGTWWGGNYYYTVTGNCSISCAKVRYDYGPYTSTKYSPSS